MLKNGFYPLYMLQPASQQQPASQPASHSQVGTFSFGLQHVCSGIRKCQLIQKTIYGQPACMLWCVHHERRHSEWDTHKNNRENRKAKQMGM
jgi:hypothetical protein